MRPHLSNPIILKGMGLRIKRDLTAVARDEERLGLISR